MEERYFRMFILFNRKIKFTKRAAMFGLDARIALAIFGALSVITGAALYSAIGNAKAVALLSDMKEINKALEQYYLDTGTLPAASTDGPKVLQSKALVEKPTGIVNWKGPYLSYKVATSNYVMEYPEYMHIHLLNLNNADWNSSMVWWNSHLCSSTDCSLWVLLNGIDNDEMAKQIDNVVDSGDGIYEGDFRVISLSGGKFGYLLKTHIVNK